LRPARLKQARGDYDEGSISLERLHAIEDEEIRKVVRFQEQLGLAVVTDGEYRRLNFQDSFGESVSGYDAGRANLKFYEHRVEGGAPLQRWEIPHSGEVKGTAVSQRRPVVTRIVSRATCR
jgi:5-methyltetrahydropteroyltriglutamate--homocysteine methyltransferase